MRSYSSESLQAFLLHQDGLARKDTLPRNRALMKHLREATFVPTMALGEFGRNCVDISVRCQSYPLESRGKSDFMGNSGRFSIYMQPIFMYRVNQATMKT